MTLTELLTNYEGLINKMARKAINRQDWSRLLDEAIQEGRIALIEAWEKFDSTKKTKFSSYAALVIRSRIQEYLAQQRYPIKLTVSAYRSIQRYYFNLHNDGMDSYTPEKLESIHELLGAIHQIDIDDEDVEL